MILIYIILLVGAGMVLGVLLGLRLRSTHYDGVIKLIEDPKGLVYSLELVGDPENLIFQKEVRFKVIPPNYEDLQNLLENEPSQ